MDSYHVPVLLQSVCAFLDIRRDGKYVDATIGGGGHTQEILARGGRVLGLDQDSDAILACRQSEALKPAMVSGNLLLETINFIHLAETVRRLHWQPSAGVLIDLGLSSHHLNTPGRGFSFQSEGPLDMRMDLSLPHTAATLVNSLPEAALVGILQDFGEVSAARVISKRIIAGRPYTTTTQLFKILGQPDVARQVFQALRIAVNDELGALQTVLPQALEVLAASGRLVVISFHSLEDRLVKDQFQSWQSAGLGQVLTPKPIIADSAELTANSRSKSAKLRTFSKTL